MNECALQTALIQVVGEAHVLTGDSMISYLTDHRGRYHGQAQAVVRPANIDEVAAVIRVCVEYGVPMVPQGGNTSLCGAATPDESGRAVVISLSRLNRIREIDTDNDTVTVEAGCTLADIHTATEALERLFPLDLPSDGTAQIGGALSTNAGGTAVLRYGNTRELVLGIEAVLPDGRILNLLRGLRKDNTGYDLKNLLIGAEGTLGIITAAVLKLYPLPKYKQTAWLAIDSPETACALLTRMRSVCGDRLTAFEIISRPSIELVFKHMPDVSDPLSEPYPWYILAEVSDVIEPEHLEALFLSALEAGMEAGEIQDAVIASGTAQANLLWHIRESMNNAQRIEGVSIKHDISIPVSKIPEFLKTAEVSLNAAFPGIRIVAFGHIGDGNIHYNVSMADADANTVFIKLRPSVNQLVYTLVDALGGSFSAEHGIGQLKIDELRKYRGDIAVELMYRIKQTFDPAGLMNPGKLFHEDGVSGWSAR